MKTDKLFGLKLRSTVTECLFRLNILFLSNFRARTYDLSGSVCRNPLNWQFNMRSLDNRVHSGEDANLFQNEAVSGIKWRK